MHSCNGAADGDMDIDFQQDGRGYYAHLHELSRLAEVDQEGYQAYRQRLQKELEAAARGDVLNHQMSVVQEQLNLYQES